MIKIDKVSVMNMENAIRGARNPMNSWGKSDSGWCQLSDCDICSLGKFGTCNCYLLGENDLALATKLCKAGSDHRKFMRQIFVSMDIEASMSWWWDFDTYKVSTTKNSCSRMHKLGSRLSTVDDFSFDDEDGVVQLTPYRQMFLDDINGRILEWQGMDKSTLEAKNLWRGIILDLPASYNFKATWTGNYEVLLNIYHARKHHKQKEFRDFCKFIEGLPYAEELICFKGVQHDS